jgi:hypothetical protein
MIDDMPRLMEENMGTTIVERLTECAGQIEDLSQRISRIRSGEIEHQARFGGGAWLDITPEVLAFYERLLETHKFYAADLREQIGHGES